MSKLFKSVFTLEGKYVLPLIIGALTYFIMVVYAPFGLSHSPASYLELRCIGFGVISALMIYVCEFNGPNYFPEVYDLEEWSVKYVLFQSYLPLIGICIGSAIYTGFVFFDDPLVPTFWRIVWYSFLIGLIPMGIMFFWKYTVHIRLNQSNIGLAEVRQTMDNRKVITIKSSVTSDSLTVSLSNIILVSAMGNYVSLHYLTDSGPRRHTSRKTFSSLAQDLPFDNFIRCHRSHLVNMDYVLRKNGNAKGLKLTVTHIDEPIQVSRKYVPAIRQWFSEKATSN